MKIRTGQGRRQVLLEGILRLLLQTTLVVDVIPTTLTLLIVNAALLSLDAAR